MAEARRYTVKDDGYRLSDELWAQMELLLPPRPSHPLGCHNPRTPDRRVMDAILFARKLAVVLRRVWSDQTEFRFGKDPAPAIAAAA